MKHINSFFAVTSEKLFFIFNILNLIFNYSLIVFVSINYFNLYRIDIKILNIDSKFKNTNSYEKLNLLFLTILPLSFLTQGYNSIFNTNSLENVLRFNSYSISFVVLIFLISLIFFKISLTLVKVTINFYKKLNNSVSYLFKKYLKSIDYLLIQNILIRKLKYLLSDIYFFLINLKLKMFLRRKKYNKSDLWVDHKNLLLVL